MKIGVLDEHAHDELGTLSLFYEAKEKNLLVDKKCDKITDK